MSSTRADSRRRRLLVGALALGTVLLLAAGIAAGSDGLSWADLVQTWHATDARLIIGEIRAPRTVGAWLTGALLGLAGAVAQGLFRNPLADPYLLGSASGATLGVVLILAAKPLAGNAISLAAADAVARFGLVGAAFVGALLGVLLTLALARGAQ
ncbi:MAG TPA: iron chelate uptake ABC transporter family permease subunit, partial [Caldimonas sp.]|nr:iron chelate uptake ABC transporter family permease subunit [Caldimonas sp.]